MSDIKERLDNTIRVVADVLEKNKENPKIKETYGDIMKLTEKRNIK